MTHIATPLVATGWNKTLINDADGNTLCLMPNGHKGLEAAQELTALWAAAPELLAALQALVWVATHHATPENEARAVLRQCRDAIAKAEGK